MAVCFHNNDNFTASRVEFSVYPFTLDILINSLGAVSHIVFVPTLEAPTETATAVSVIK